MSIIVIEVPVSIEPLEVKGYHNKQILDAFKRSER